jgi:NAD(P)H-hydrate epimerase
MKLVSSAQMREFDRRTIEELDVPGEVLMDRAGYGVARAARDMAQLAGYGEAPVQVFAGRGNNGGDAFVAARYLREWGANVEVWMVGDLRSVRGDALTHYGRMKGAGLQARELPTQEDFDGFDLSSFDGGIMIDGVLGTGIAGPARGPAAGAIRCINAMGARGLVVSIDLPSGLNADTGEASGDTVRADLTVTMGFPKAGLAAPEALDYAGSVEVVDIGIPAAFGDGVEGRLELIALGEVQALFPRRHRAAHKGDFGRTLLIGGARGYAGAAGLAARAAVRSGVGLVSVLTPASVAPVVAGMCPEAMVHAGKETADGTLAADALAASGLNMDTFQSVLVGPGMTARRETASVLNAVLNHVSGVVVADADALNVSASRLDRFKAARGTVILTPHPGEMARLIGSTAGDVQQDRLGSLDVCAEKSRSIVVLKGAGTLVGAAGHAARINLNGNPGMATGGSGDVLAGLLAGIAAQPLAPLDAACAAVFLHGHAGDVAAWGGTQTTLCAGDIVAALPTALRICSPR